MSGLLWWLASPQVAIDDALVADAPTLAAIHGECFAHEWSADEFAVLMRDPRVFGLVVRRANIYGTRSPVGFVLIRVAADEAEILTVAVQPRHQGRGLARQVIEAAFRRLYRDRIKSVFLEVDAGNQPALAVYRKLGFRKVGERKGYYRSASPEASALVMRADLL